MAIQIINNGASLKIVTANAVRYILKNKISNVVVINDTTIKINSCKGTLYDIFINQAEVIVPVTSSTTDLCDKITDMLQSDNSSEFTTEQKRAEINSGIANLKNDLTEIKDKINILNAKLFYEPRLVDATNPDMVYNGFANLGSSMSMPCWAILRITNNKGVRSYLWANGNKNFNNVWDNRKLIFYSKNET